MAAGLSDCRPRVRPGKARLFVGGPNARYSLHRRSLRFFFFARELALLRPHASVHARVREPAYARHGPLVRESLRGPIPIA